MTVQLPNFSFRKRAKARRAVGTSAKAVMFHPVFLQPEVAFVEVFNQ